MELLKMNITYEAIYQALNAIQTKLDEKTDLATFIFLLNNELFPRLQIEPFQPELSNTPAPLHANLYLERRDIISNFVIALFIFHGVFKLGMWINQYVDEEDLNISLLFIDLVLLVIAVMAMIKLMGFAYQFVSLNNIMEKRIEWTQLLMKKNIEHVETAMQHSSPSQYDENTLLNYKKFMKREFLEFSTGVAYNLADVMDISTLQHDVAHYADIEKIKQTSY